MASSQREDETGRGWAWLLLIVITCPLAACAWMDHLTSASLQKELNEKSKGGLALARWVPAIASIELRFFDGRTQVVPLGCCRSATAVGVLRNRIVAVDTPSVPLFDPLHPPVGTEMIMSRFGGQLVVMDERGRPVSRSELSLLSSGGRSVALSPDRTRFAFIGVAAGFGVAENGIYVAGFRDAVARKLLGVGPSPGAEVGRPAPQTVLDWSPDGDHLLLSHGGGVWLVDVRTGDSRKVADGGVALWSPAGRWISYADANFEPALLDITTGESKRIDPEHGTGSPLEWSPDGAYLLIWEGQGSHVPFGTRWVYRISDGAFAALPYYNGMGGQPAQWIQVDN
jgi:hypothetical protein